MPGTLARQRPRLGDGCQSGEMATLLHTLCFVFKYSFQSTFRVKYYDFIVKWCSGISFDGCASLDIGFILAVFLMLIFIPEHL